MWDVGLLGSPFGWKAFEVGVLAQDLGLDMLLTPGVWLRLYVDSRRVPCEFHEELCETYQPQTLPKTPSLEAHKPQTPQTLKSQTPKL